MAGSIVWWKTVLYGKKTGFGAQHRIPVTNFHKFNEAAECSENF